MSYENAKLVLSGGSASRPYFEEICSVAGTEQPNIVFDTSPRVTQKNYDDTRTAFTTAFKALNFPEPKWAQDSIDDPLNREKLSALLDDADVLMVTGGATKHGYEKWVRSNIAGLILERVIKGDIVAAGGSAGAMIWFDQGYSDSMSYEVEEGEHWEYINAQGAGLFSSWVTAHHTDIDTLGRDRRQLFVDFLEGHKGEWDTAVGIDTGAALIVQNGLVRVKDISVPQRPADGNVHLYSQDSLAPLELSDGDVLSLDRF